MTKLNWEKLNQYDKLSRHPRFGSLEKTASRGLKRRVKPKAKLFPAQWEGTCSTCKRTFAKGAPIKFNVKDEIVHGRGCPRKPNTVKVTPLAR